MTVRALLALTEAYKLKVVSSWFVGSSVCGTKYVESYTLGIFISQPWLAVVFRHWRGLCHH